MVKKKMNYKLMISILIVIAFSIFSCSSYHSSMLAPNNDQKVADNNMSLQYPELKNEQLTQPQVAEYSKRKLSIKLSASFEGSPQNSHSWVAYEGDKIISEEELFILTVGKANFPTSSENQAFTNQRSNNTAIFILKMSLILGGLWIVLDAMNRETIEEGAIFPKKDPDWPMAFAGLGMEMFGVFFLNEKKIQKVSSIKINHSTYSEVKAICDDYNRKLIETIKTNSIQEKY